MALSNFAVAARALAAQSAPPDMLAGALDEIVEQSKRASEIVKRVRAFINPQRGHHENLAIDGVIAHAAALLTPELRRDGVNLQLALDDGGARVRGDRVLLEQVLVNLIHNAMHAMQDSPRGRIDLTSRRVDQGVRITVTDAGPGIPPEQLDQIFAPFFTTRPDGLGLGLNICRTIVEAHGGAMSVDNPAGGGAAFSFTLPTVP
jgi:C4-dicarboxylate-specific signal transduction histidine kinase